ncbi:leucine-rich repeat-containing protein 70 [Pelobates fuscus]|uniref:leucine-rich repeat-containing protein 70 n=1 Tax=Pelobates fuscus TaxID=191477 RepID=UPI002FE4CF38
MNTRHRDVQGSQCCLNVLQLSLRGFFLLLLLYKHILCCPSVCPRCTGRQVNCRDVGLTTVPMNLPENTTLINLSGNNITHISRNEFVKLPKLAVLYLEKANVCCVQPKTFASLKNLYYLYLNDNSIKHLPPSVFEGLLQLNLLHLQNNQIGILHQGLFDQLKSVRYLSLQRNLLSVLGNHTFFGLISLRTLNLSNNNISQISVSAFRYLEDLESLYLEGNQLMQVPSEALGILKHLKRLSLSNNPLKSLHSLAFKGLDSLQHLFLANSNIQTIYEKAFYSLSNLKHLILCNNKLDTLNWNTFTYLNHLIDLQLDRNNISSVSENAFEEMGASLKVLNLAFNNLTFLQPKVLQPLISLTHFQANYNPWDCGCDFLEIRNFLLSSSFTFSIHCQNPSRLRGRPMRHIILSEFQDCLTTNTFHQANQQADVVTTVSFYSHIKSATYRTWSDTSSQSADDILTTTVSTLSEINTHILPINTTELAFPHGEIPENLAPVNLTRDADSHFPPSVITVSLKPLVICQQELESVNQSFHILLSFFLLSCVVIVFLSVRIMQLRRKIITPENPADNVLEYYSCYQSGRYQMADPIRIATPNPALSSEIDLIRPLKNSTPDNQTQVILFEHSVL